MNRSFVERGGFFGLTARGVVDGTQSVCNFRAGETVRPNQQLFRRTNPAASAANASPIFSGLQESGRVAFVAQKTSSEHTGMRFYRAEAPKVGDKFVTMNSQKGTAGIYVADHDMPYTLDGLTPDVMLNPHAIPSRLTVGLVAELLRATGVAEDSDQAVEYGFGETSLDAAEALLRRHSRECGLREFVDPHTGHRISCRIFMGFCYYSRLKHIVDDKVRQIDIYGAEINRDSRQPECGRKLNGGIKIAEMERWALAAHGASGTIHERFTKMSDAMPLHFDPGSRSVVSDVWQSGAETHRVPLTYAFARFMTSINQLFLDVKLDTS